MKVTLLIAFVVLLVIEARDVGNKRQRTDSGGGSTQGAGKRQRTESAGDKSGNGSSTAKGNGTTSGTGAGGDKMGGMMKAPDDGMVPHPAFVSYSGCKLKTKSLAGCKTKGNPHVQMGEAWSNPRVLNQRVAFFVPYKPGQQHYDSEGGPYGDVTAYDCLPNKTDLAPSKNPAAWCFFWEAGLNGKTKNDSSKMPTGPGVKAIPMPIICPHNLDNCYSKSWFEPNGKLAKYGSLKPSYQGVWFPPKSKTGSKPLFCQGLNLGCPTPTMREMQLDNLASVKCNVANCKPAPAVAEV